MDDSIATKLIRLQPLTFGGVARLAQCPLHQLFSVALAVAVIAAASAVWFLAIAWWPVIDDAIGKLPDQGLIQGGQLQWQGNSPARLGERPFLAILVDAEGATEFGQVSDLQIEFGQSGLILRSMFGYVSLPYPDGWVIAVNRKTLEPLWGAWQPVLLAVAGLLVVLVLLLGWSLLAAIYAVPVWLVALFLNRDAAMPRCGRLAFAALMPGAILVTVAIVLYGLQRLDLVGFIAANGVHFLVGWVYSLCAPYYLPRVAGAARRSVNPFADEKN